MENDLEVVREYPVIRPKGDLVIRIERITKEYAMGHTTIRALKGADLCIQRNGYLAVMDSPEREIDLDEHPWLPRHADNRTV
jgi:hypothetical protein